MADVAAAPPDRRRSLLVVALAAVLAAVPIVRMVTTIRTGSRTQHADYWIMIEGLYRRNGWFDVGALFTWSNEHPVAVAKFLYWSNARLFDGSNISLGYIVVLIGAATVALIAALLWSRSSRLVFVAATVATSALVFAPQGTWNYWKAMSGAAWLSANALAVLAVFLRLKVGRWPALVPAVLASFAYSTGLAAWPALLVAGLATSRRVRHEWPAAAGMVVTYTWYLVTLLGRDQAPSTPGGVREILEHVASVAGSIFVPGSSTGADLVGAAGLLAGAVLAVVALRGDTARAAPWLGLYVFSVGALVMVGTGRDRLAAAAPQLGTFRDGRYCSLAALLWVSVLLLAATVIRRDVVLVVLAAGATLAASVTGGSSVDLLRDLNPGQELLAVAQRLHLADGSTFFSGLGEVMPADTPSLEAIGHHPFDGHFRAGCGLLGQHLGPEVVRARRVRELTPAGTPAGRVDAVGRVPGLPRGVAYRGWVNERARCVLAVDRHGVVVGAAVFGFRPDPERPAPADRQFYGLSPTWSGRHRIYAVGG